MGTRILGGKPLNALLILQNFLDFPGNGLQLRQIIAVFIGINGTPGHGELHRQTVHCHELCAVGLGGGHGDFRSGQSIEYLVSLPGNGASHHVDHGKGAHALLLRHPQGGQGVRRLAGLADNDDQGAFVEGGPPVAELRRQLHPDRDARQILNHIL